MRTIYMKFIIKTVTLYKDKELNIYTPLKIPKQLTAIDPMVWDKAILGNSISYEFLKKMFLLASSLNSHEMIYIPTYPIKFNEYRESWNYGIFDMDIVLVNYHSTQLKNKEIFKAVKMNSTGAKKIREITFENQSIKYPEHWQTHKKFSTKRFKNILIISANRDVFLKFACDTDGFVGMEDDEQYNFDYHYHEDLIATAKDNGFNFLYYHNKKNL